MKPLLLLFFFAISIVSSHDNWEGIIIRSSPTDCSACQFAHAGFSQQIPDSLFSGLSTKCSLLPNDLGSVCEKGLSTIINYIKEGLTSRIPNCEVPCASPSPISSSHICSLIQPAFHSLDSLFTDLSSNLIPTMCKTHSDQQGCAKKIDGLLKIGKTPVTNVFKRMGILLDCEELKSIGDPGKLGSAWTTQSVLCTACQTTLKGIALTIDGEDTLHLIEAVHTVFQSTCERIRREDSTVLEGAPYCPDIAAILVRKLREDEGANDSLCQLAYECPAMRSNNKDEL